MTEEDFNIDEKLISKAEKEYEAELQKNKIIDNTAKSSVDCKVILQKAGMDGDWELINKIERKCAHCSDQLYSAERKTILHGYERATICLECKTVHQQERFWNGK